ncbi:MAG: 5-deoxy-glucuronate isomerase [Sphaerochaetaceae bacterium]|jgi:5-deoxy-glucuronate isomerase
MVVKKEGKFARGYNAITELDGKHSDVLLDFGILVLEAGDTYDCQLPLERAYLLIKGDVTFSWEDQNVQAARYSVFDEEPSVLHVPTKVAVTIKASTYSELAVERSRNDKVFASKFYAPKDTRSDIFGGGVLNEASIRTVRTVFDGETNPDSNMVLGEVINHPGKWSSYPPHDHPHPEIYHYRFFPKQGFGISIFEEDPHFVQDGDTSLIEPNKTHSQVAAAGYAMYYIWMIPHLPHDRWLPTTRYFAKQHEWMLEKDVKIWPERPYEEQ